MSKKFDFSGFYDFCHRHMGPLSSLRYGSLLKAIYKFTLVRQNYGKPLFVILILHFLGIWNILGFLGKNIIQ